MFYSKNPPFLFYILDSLTRYSFNYKFTSQKISLPPLIEDRKDRKVVVSGLRRSRTRYRLFRSRLSQEVSQSKGMLQLINYEVFD